MAKRKRTKELTITYKPLHTQKQTIARHEIYKTPE